MIEHVYRRATAVSGIGSVVVATDDPRVRDAVVAFGGEVRLTRPDHRNGTERLAEVAADLETDLVVNIQGDEPLLDPTAVNAALAAFDDEPSLGLSTLRTPIRHPADLDDPHVVKVVVDRDGYALYFSRAAIPGRRPGSDEPAAAFKHIGLYVYARRLLLELARLTPTPLERVEGLEQLRALEYGHRIKTVETAHDPVGVDTPEDLARVRRIMEAGAAQ